MRPRKQKAPKKERPIVLSSKKRRRDPDETLDERRARWERQEHAERSRYPRHPTRHHQRQRVHLTVERVRLDRGGYEKSGRYWGTGEPLFRVSGELWREGKLYIIDLHVRARNAQEARAKVAEEERVVGVARAARARASRDPKRGRLQHKASLLRKLEAAWRRQYEGRAKGHEVHDTMQAFLNAGGTEQELHAAMNRATKRTEKHREGSYRRGR